MGIVQSCWSNRRFAVVLVALIATLTLAATAQASSRHVSSSARAHALSAFRHDPALVALGRRRGARHASHARAAVVGGALTSIEQVPWQVAVFAEFEFEEELFGLLCGGSIVRDMNHVLTAGHCAFNPITGEKLPPGDFTVVAGVSSISEKEIAEGPTSQAKAVSAARAHPYFDYLAGPGTPDDVAELELATPLQASAAVAMVALPSPGTLPAEGESAVLSGFGEEEPRADELDGNLYSLAEQLGFSRQCGGEANAVFVCASSSGGSACSGDSGGALVGGGAQQQIGVVDTVALVGGERCTHGALNGFANVAAPEIRDFVEGSEAPPVAPRGGGAGIRGFIEVGKSLTCEPGSWSGSPTYAYAFVDGADGLVLQRGPAATYPLTSADIGRPILCEVSATNAGGTGVGRTPALPPIEQARTVPGTGPAVGPSAGAGPTQAVAVSAPPSGAGVLGSSAQSISVSQIAALLKKALAPSGKLAKIASLLRSGSTTVTFAAPQAGSASISWFLAGARASSARGQAAKPLLVAAGHKAFAKAGSGRIAIVLTSAGKRALRGRKHVTLTAKGTFTRAGASAVTVAKTFVLAG
jgi:hypothetical protein